MDFDELLASYQEPEQPDVNSGEADEADIPPLANPAQQPAPSFDDLLKGGASFDDLLNVVPQRGTQEQPEQGKLEVAARSVAESAVPSLAAYPAMVAGAALGAPLGPIGSFVGGAAGAIGAGYLTSTAQRYLLDALGFSEGNGFFSTKREQAGLQQHPYIAQAAEFIPQAATFGFGRGAVSGAQRLFAAGAMGGISAGQQLAMTGDIDPTSVGIAALGGAAMPVPRKWAQRIGEPIERGIASVMPKRIATSTAVKAPSGEEPTPVTTETAVEPTAPQAGEVTVPDATQSEPVKVTRGAAQDQGAVPGAKSTDGTGATINVARSEREYPKVQGPAEEGKPAVSILKEDGIDDTARAALNADKYVPSKSAPAELSTGPERYQTFGEDGAYNVIDSVTGEQLGRYPYESNRESLINAWGKALEHKHRLNAEETQQAQARPVEQPQQATPEQPQVPVEQPTPAVEQPQQATPEQPAAALVEQAFKPSPGRPKAVTRAIDEAKRRGDMELHNALVSEKNPESQGKAATAALQMYEAMDKNGGQLPEGWKPNLDIATIRTPKKRLTTKSGKVVATQADLDRANKSDAILEDTYNKFGPKENAPQVVGVQAVNDLTKRLQDAWDHATKLAGGADPLKVYRGRDVSKERQWLRAAQTFLKSAKTQRNANTFDAAEREIRSGSRETIEGNKIEAQIARRKAPTTEQAVRQQEEMQRPVHEVDEDEPNWANLPRERIMELVPAEDVRGRETPVLPGQIAKPAFSESRLIPKGQAKPPFEDILATVPPEQRAKALEFLETEVKKYPGMRHELRGFRQVLARNLAKYFRDEADAVKASHVPEWKVEADQRAWTDPERALIESQQTPTSRKPPFPESVTAYGKGPKGRGFSTRSPEALLAARKAAATLQTEARSKGEILRSMEERRLAEEKAAGLIKTYEPEAGEEAPVKPEKRGYRRTPKEKDTAFTPKLELAEEGEKLPGGNWQEAEIERASKIARQREARLAAGKNLPKRELADIEGLDTEAGPYTKAMQEEVAREEAAEKNLPKRLGWTRVEEKPLTLDKYNENVRTKRTKMLDRLLRGLPADEEGGLRLPKWLSSDEESAIKLPEAPEGLKKLKEKLSRGTSGKYYAHLDTTPEAKVGSDVGDLLHTLSQKEVTNHTRAALESEALPKEFNDAGIQQDITRKWVRGQLSSLPQKTQDYVKKWLYPIRDFNQDIKGKIDAIMPDLQILKNHDPDFLERIAKFGEKGSYKEGISPDPVEGAYRAHKRGVGTKAGTVMDRKFFVLEDNATGERTVISPSREEGGYVEWLGRRAKGVSAPGFQGELGETLTQNGKQYTVKNAYPDEIAKHAMFDKNTQAAYHENAALSLLTTKAKLIDMYEQVKALSDLFKTKQWNKFATLDKTRAEQNGWDRPDIPGPAGKWYMHPALKEHFDDFARPGFNGDDLARIRTLVQATTKTMFWLPVAHAFNVGAHWFVGRGWDWLNPTGYANLAKTAAKAIEIVSTPNHPMMRRMREEGMGSIFEGVRRKEWENDMARTLGTVVERLPNKFWDPIAKTLNVDPRDLVKSVYNTSAKSMWAVNDVLLVQQVLEDRLKGMTLPEAIIHAERHIPNYRVPTRVMGSRFISKLLQDPLFSFGRYHYGMFNSYAHQIKDVINGTGAQRAEAAGNMVAIGLLAFIVKPMLDAVWQKVTGDPNAEARARGPLSVPSHIYKAAEGTEDISSAIGASLTTSPLLSTAMETIKNKDWAGRPIMEPGDWYRAAHGKTLGEKAGAVAALGAQEAGHLVKGLISPINTAFGAWKRGDTPAKMLRNQFLDINQPSPQQLAYLARARVRHLQEAARRQANPPDPLEAAVNYITGR